MGEVEVVAEVVEKVATTADKALEEVANQLPDNSKLKEAAQVLEHISSAAAQDAQTVENIINKVVIIYVYPKKLVYTFNFQLHISEEY